MRREFSDEEYRQFREWISTRFGIVYGPEKREMLRIRLERRRAALGLDRYADLLFHLKFHPDRESEIDRLLPHLTNNESYFFRERTTLEVFERQILPELAKTTNTQGGRPARILSAACASGEEPYTLSILAKRSAAGPHEIRLTGMDLDPVVLERARKAEYRAHALRGVEDRDRHRYFLADPSSERWTLRPEYRDQVRFLRGNLLAEDWVRASPAQDVIFCRNVLIYFDQDSIEIVVDRIYDTLRPGGYLFLGHSETLRRVPGHPFEVHRRPGCVFYRKETQ